jgi:hypothetical protein
MESDEKRPFLKIFCKSDEKFYFYGEKYFWRVLGGHIMMSQSFGGKLFTVWKYSSISCQIVSKTAIFDHF